MPILPKERDPRLITIRRGGTLTDEDHRLLAEWALRCAEHVLPLFEDHQPGDLRPREAIDLGRAWISGEVRMRESRNSAFGANAAGAGCPIRRGSRRCRLDRRRRCPRRRPRSRRCRVRHQGGRRAVAAGDAGRGRRNGTGSGAAPGRLRELVLDDQERRSAICWHVFDD